MSCERPDLVGMFLLTIYLKKMPVEEGEEKRMVLPLPLLSGGSVVRMLHQQVENEDSMGTCRHSQDPIYDHEADFKFHLCVYSIVLGT